MKAVVWHGSQDIRVEEVTEPKLEEPTDAIIRVTSTAICGSDLHLYEVMGPFMGEGDILGHEPMGIVEEVGSGVTNLKRGDRVVVPFNICCGDCFMCSRGLQSQCETTQNHDKGMGAALFGYTRLYGQVPGGQAQYLRVPQAHYGPIKVPEGPVDDRFLFLSDVLPTAWQAAAYAGVEPGHSVVVLGLGPIGVMACRAAMQQGAESVIGIDLVPERLDRARNDGVTVVNLCDYDDPVETVLALTNGRGPHSVIDAVGMNAHGANFTQVAQSAAQFLPDAVVEKMAKTVGIDRLTSLHLAIELVRRGGTISISGVYGGAADPLPMLTLFDKQIQIRMGQANVRRWVDEILPLVLDDNDPLKTESFATHHMPLSEAPRAYEIFHKKLEGAQKIVLKP